MKILKYKFRIPKLEIVDDELVEDGFTEETYTFTLLHRGVGLFEELTGKPLMAYLGEIQMDEQDALRKLLSKDFVQNLASASYCKIENGKFHNNRATVEEFKKLPVAQKLTEDTNFLIELVQMAMDCMMIEAKEEANTKKAVTKSKKA